MEAGVMGHMGGEAHGQGGTWVMGPVGIASLIPHGSFKNFIAHRS